MNTRFKQIIENFRDSCMNGPNRHNHVACILKGKRVIKFAFNDTLREYIDGTRMSSLHAEHACLRNCNCNGRNILILRYGRKGELKDSKPCANCKHFMISKGIQYVFCSMDDGSVQKIKLSDLELYLSRS